MRAFPSKQNPFISRPLNVSLETSHSRLFAVHHFQLRFPSRVLHANTDALVGRAHWTTSEFCIRVNLCAGGFNLSYNTRSLLCFSVFVWCFFIFEIFFLVTVQTFFLGDRVFQKHQKRKVVARRKKPTAQLRNWRPQGREEPSQWCLISRVC